MRGTGVHDASARADGPPRLLVVAYSCNPTMGSEPGAAWGTVQALAEYTRPIVLVSSRHGPDIRAWEEAHPGSPATFLIVPEAGWTRQLHRVAQVHRQVIFLAYLAWMRNAERFARSLVAGQDIDAAIHLAYGSYWLPAFVGRLGIPGIWGPVGGATTTPWRLWPFLGVRGLIGELEKRLAISLVSLLPGTRRTWREASVRITETATTRDHLPRRLRPGTLLAQRAVLSHVPDIERLPRDRFVLFAYSLQGRKGPRLALRAFAQAPADLRLVFADRGYEEPALRELAQELGVADRVDFIDRVPRQEVFQLMRRASVVLFPGLREEGGCTLAEAMLLGAPVVVLGHGGARMIAEYGTDPDRMDIVEPGTPRQTVARMAAGITRLVDVASQDHSSHLDTGPTLEALRAGVEAALGRPVQLEAAHAEDEGRAHNHSR